MSILFMLLGAVGACSSKSTDDENSGGKGGLITAGSGGSANGGSASGGSANGGGGNTTAGMTAAGGSGAGTPGTAGGGAAAQECLNQPVVCLDDDTASFCDPDTLMDETVVCSTGVQQLGPGLISNGCITDADGSGCSFGFEDETCRDGAAALGVCLRAAGQDIDDLTAYFACFSDEADGELRTTMACFAGFIDQAQSTVACSDAEAACLTDAAGGAGGADGAGGAGGAGG